jgi:hypothetical protein
MSKTTTTKTPMTACRKQLLAGLCGAVLVAGISVPVAFAALDDGQYCVTAVGYEDEFEGNQGICPAEFGTDDPAAEPTVEPSPTAEPTVPVTPAPTPTPVETTPPLETDPAACDLDAASAAAEDLSMRAMFSDVSGSVRNTLRSTVYTDATLGYSDSQAITLTVDRAKAAEAYCAGENLAASVSVDHRYNVNLKTTGFSSVNLGTITAHTTGSLADTKSVLARQTLGGARTDGVYNGLDANLSTIVNNEIRKDLGI